MKKHPIVLYCKSYRDDVYEVKRLLRSVQKFNKDNIPFYISVPTLDISLFKEVLGNLSYILIPDEQIYTSTTNFTGWVSQQLVRSNFYRLDICHNYLSLDSDAIFISDFYINDFLAYDNIPYSIFHEANEHKIRLYTINNKKSWYELDYFSTAKFVRKTLDSTYIKKWYVYGHTPYLWNCNVWKSFDNMLSENGMNMDQYYLMLQKNNIHPRETVIYGEYLLATNLIPIIPSAELFRVFDSHELYEWDIQNKLDLEFYRQFYKGVSFQDGRTGREKGITWYNSIINEILNQINI